MEKPACLLFLHALASVALLAAAVAEETFQASRTPMAFSDLPIARQRSIEDRVAAPPNAERDAPYSAVMYYLLAKDYRDGIGSVNGGGNLVLDRNRPDWQEVLLRDWHELGLVSTHFLTWPGQWKTAENIQAISDYLLLSEKHGLRVGIRLGGDTETLGGLEGSGWDLHPRNLENRFEEYLCWTRQVAELCQGRVEYYVLGDELNIGAWEEPVGTTGETQVFKTQEDRRWSPAIYMKAFEPLADAIRTIDRNVDVSMFGIARSDLTYLDGLFEANYRRHAQGVTINCMSLSDEDLLRVASHVRAEAPELKLYSSNGGRLFAARDTDFYPTNLDMTTYSEQEHAEKVAKRAFLEFLHGWHRAPYYTPIRRWVLPDGSTAPHWYGMSGLMDLVIDGNGNLTVKRWPSWYAYQTVAHLFYSQGRTKPATFEVASERPISFMRAFVRDDYECLIALWDDAVDEDRIETLTVPTQRYTYPVHVSLGNYRQAADLRYRVEADGTLQIFDVPVSSAPVFIRLVAEKQEYGGR